MRGAAVAAAGFMPWSTMLRITCATVVMMRLPPGLPVASSGRPSRNRMVGVIELSGRWPGRTALASPPIRP